MPQLDALCTRIQWLRRARDLWRLARLAAVWSLIAVGVCAALLAADWTLRLPRVGRALLLAPTLVAATAAVLLGLRRWGRSRESLEQTALAVEGRHGLENDLIAALQFDGQDASAGESRALRAAIVARVAERAGTLNVFDGFPWASLRRAAWLVCGSATLLIAAWLAAPRHVATFAERVFLLSDAAYPTRTKVVEIRLNDHTVWAADARRGTGPVVAEDATLRFEVRASESRRRVGRIEARIGSTTTSVSLARLDGPPSQDEPAVERYLAERPAMPGSFEFRVRLDDAVSDWFPVRVVARPSLLTEHVVEDPRHVRAPVDPAMRTVTGLQGEVWRSSNVMVRVTTLDGRRIRSCRISFLPPDTAGGAARPDGGDGASWSYRGPPLAPLRRDVQLQVQAVDEYGIRLKEPIVGALRVRRDDPPQAWLGTPHRVVLPEARPELLCRVSDDVALADVRLLVDLERGGTRTGGPAATDQADAPQDGQSVVSDPNAADQRWERHVVPLPLPGRPWSSQGASWTHRAPLPLAPHRLVSGDLVRVALEAVDDRGEDEGLATRSQPIVLRVGELSDVLEDVMQLDAEADRRLEELIERQIGRESSR